MTPDRQQSDTIARCDHEKASFVLEMTVDDVMDIITIEGSDLAKFLGIYVDNFSLREKAKFSLLADASFMGDCRF